MHVDVQPPPSDEERAAIVAALHEPASGQDEGWSAAALLEGLEDAEFEP